MSACGGSEAPVATSEAAAAASDGSSADAAPSEGAEAGGDAEAAAAANIGLLQTSAQVTDIEVLDVADGSIATLRQAVDGDRPVLLWFFSPH